MFCVVHIETDLIRLHTGMFVFRIYIYEYQSQKMKTNPKHIVANKQKPDNQPENHFAIYLMVWRHHKHNFFQPQLQYMLIKWNNRESVMH